MKSTTILFSELYVKPRSGPQVYRCEECKALTDDPDGHAKWHAGPEIAEPGETPKTDWPGKRHDSIGEVEVKVDAAVAEPEPVDDKPGDDKPPADKRAKPTTLKR